MEPLVSIIMPSYNSANYIGKSIESVIEQDYQNWELLITDDLSTDNTVELVLQYVQAEPRIKLHIQSKNGGAGLARNNAIERAAGSYIAFLDSDDLWHPEKLVKQIEFMQKHGSALSYTGYRKFNSEEFMGTIIPPEKVNYRKLLNSNVIGCLTAIYDVEKLGKVYMPIIRKRQDMALWLKILKEVPYAYGLPEVLAYYRVDSGMSKNKFEMLKWQWKLYRDVEKLSLLRSIKCQIKYAFKGFVKYSK